MKRLIFLVMITISLQANKIKLNDFVSIVSDKIGLTIVTDELISDDIFVSFGSQDLNGIDYISLLKNVLKKYNLEMIRYKKFFLVTKRDYVSPNIDKFRIVQLKNVNINSVKNIFNTLNEFKYSYIPTSKIITYVANDDLHKRIKEAISKSDVLPRQLKLYITVVQTDLNKLKDIGSSLDFSIVNDSNFFLNLISFPFKVNSVIDSSKKISLINTIRLLQQNGITNIVASPVLTIFENEKSKFFSGKKIPYKTTSVSNNNDGSTSTSENLDYRNIGFNIEVLPNIYSSNVYLDIKLDYETLLTNDNNVPITSTSNFVNPKFTMQLNKLYFLTGLNQNNYSLIEDKIPFFGDIPYLKHLFKREQKEETQTNITIVLELKND